MYVHIGEVLKQYARYIGTWSKVNMMNKSMVRRKYRKFLQVMLSGFLSTHLLKSYLIDPLMLRPKSSFQG